MLERMEYLNLEIKHCFVAFSKWISKGSSRYDLNWGGGVSYFPSDDDVHTVGRSKPCWTNGTDGLNLPQGFLFS